MHIHTYIFPDNKRTVLASSERPPANSPTCHLNHCEIAFTALYLRSSDRYRYLSSAQGKAVGVPLSQADHRRHGHLLLLCAADELGQAVAALVHFHAETHLRGQRGDLLTVGPHLVHHRQQAQLRGRQPSIDMFMSAEFMQYPKDTSNIESIYKPMLMPMQIILQRYVYHHEEVRYDAMLTTEGSRRPRTPRALRRTSPRIRRWLCAP